MKMITNFKLRRNKLISFITKLVLRHLVAFATDNLNSIILEKCPHRRFETLFQLSD